MPRKKRRPSAGSFDARHPANPQASRSGSGLHSGSRYSKKNRRSGKKEIAAGDADG